MFGWHTYTNVEKIEVYYSSKYSFSSRLHFCPDQWMFFWDSQHCGPTTASKRRGWEWPEQPWLCKHWYWLSSSIRDTGTHSWSKRLPKVPFAFQQIARSYQANLINVWMGSLHHALGCKENHCAVPAVYVQCF